jgi:hypothetical protein
MNTADLAKKFEYEEAFEHGIRSDSKANVDSMIIAMRTFAPIGNRDGTAGSPELAIGAVAEGGYRHGFVPIADVVKFALLNCPEMVAELIVKTGSTRDMARMTQEILTDLDLQSGN